MVVRYFGLKLFHLIKENTMIAINFGVRNLNVEKTKHEYVKTLNEAINIWKTAPTTATIWAYDSDGRAMIIQEPIK